MNYAIESHVGDLDRFVEALGLERFVLVGMSLGGANALAWAAGTAHASPGSSSSTSGPRPARRA
jgi:pimeloyl-ACP methyl ester carboxylesterase